MSPSYPPLAAAATRAAATGAAAATACAPGPRGLLLLLALRRHLGARKGGTQGSATETARRHMGGRAWFESLRLLRSSSRTVLPCPRFKRGSRAAEATREGLGAPTRL